jgi:serine/threonine protein kinase
MDSRQSLPNWTESSWATSIPNLRLDVDGIDLLKMLLTYDPPNRISAKAALQHVRLFYDLQQNQIFVFV